MLNSYLHGSLVLEIKSEVERELREDLAGLQPEEAAVLAVLQARLKQATKDGSTLRLLNASSSARRGNRSTAHAA